MDIQDATRESAMARDGKGTSTDERALVVQAKSGQSSAFGELYERYRFKIYRSAFRILRNPQDAEDAVQQAFQHAFTNLHRFRETSAFATWVTRIAINEALTILRQRRVTTPLFENNNDGVNATPPFDLADVQPRNKPSLKKKVAPL